MAASRDDLIIRQVLAIREQCEALLLTLGLTKEPAAPQAEAPPNVARVFGGNRHKQTEASNGG